MKDTSLRTTRRLFAILGILGTAIAAIAFGSPVGAQDEPELTVTFDSISLKESTELPGVVTELISAGGETKFASVDAGALMGQLQGAESVRLELFENLALQMNVVEAGDGVAGSRFWAAQGNGASATFTELNGRLDGRMVVGPSLYRIVGFADGVGLIAQDKIAYRPEAAMQADANGEANLEATPGMSDGGSAVTSSTVDVLAWYDSGAIGIFGSSSNAEVAIAGSYNNANFAASRGNANMQFNLVELDYVSWTPPSNDQSALSAIRSVSDGRMDQVHAARDAAGADLVAVIGDLNQYCGLAYLPIVGSPSSDQWGFSYTAANCVGGNLTLVHETGHNMGAGHDNGNGNGSYSFSHGYINPSVGYRTVMAYATFCSGCVRIPYFSSPTGSYVGNPTGTAAADNGRTLRLLAPAVAAYRDVSSVAVVTNADIVEDEGDRGSKRLRVWFTLDKPAIPFEGTGFASMRVQTADGTATVADRDYRRVTRNVRWGPGVTERFADFTITGDTKRENDEYFDLILSNPNKVDLGDGRVRVWIRNDDTDDPPTVSAVSTTVTETDRNQVVRVSVELDRAASVTTRVRWTTTPGSATAADDYVNRSGVVSIPRGRTSRTFNVTLRGDLDQESTEFFNIVLSDPVGLQLGSNAVITVLDNDNQPPPLVTVDDVQVVETDRNQVVRVTVRLDRPASATTRVRYETTAGSASVGSDFVNRRGTVTFPRGRTERTVSVTVRGDRISEPTERFYIDLSSPTGLRIGSDWFGTVEIFDND